MRGTVLLCSDASEQALTAARVAAAIAKRFETDVVVLSVFYAPVTTYTTVGEVGIDWDAISKWGEQVHAGVRERTAPILDSATVRYRFLPKMGHPVDMAVDTAQDEHVGLIVLGSRGLGLWKSLLLGSVSEGVLFHAHCPVLIVRGEKAAGTDLGFKRILLATDGSEGAAAAARIAAEFADKFGAELVILSVFNPYADYRDVSRENLDPDVYGAQVRAMVQARTTKALAAAHTQFTFRDEMGRPAERITHVAKEGGFDLVVMGSRGLGGFHSMLLGSVSAAVAREAPCPVLIAR